MATFNETNQNNATVQGTTGNDTVNLSGNGTTDTFNLIDGNDVINTDGTANYISSVFNLGFGDDSVGGGIGSNSLVYGNQGNDTIDLNVAASGIKAYGGQGNDNVVVTAGTGYQIYGNIGSDTINLGGLAGGVGASGLYGGQGSDTIIGGSSSDTIFGGLASDNITSAGAASLVYGNQGDDTIAIGGNSTTTFGGQGSDTVTVTTTGTAGTFVQNALIYGNIGNDSVTLVSANSSQVYGGQGADTLIVSSAGAQGAATGTTVGAFDSLFGGQGNDVITTGLNQASIDGGDGNDIITASNNYTSITGGAGSDQFVITGANVQGTAATAPTGTTAAAPTTTGGTNATAHALTINDFVSGTDQINLGGASGSNANFATATVNGGLQAAINQTGGLAQGSYLFVAGSSNGYLFYNNGGALTGTTLIGQNNIADVKATDIIGGATVAAANTAVQ